MKNIIYILLITLLLSCKNKTVINSTQVNSVQSSQVNTYPESVSRVFKAHGGLDRWNALRTLQFTMNKPNGKEVTLTDLRNRKSLISTNKFQIGYNGTDVWINQDSLHYKGDPKFYYNLMFYFYAMPFILADSGINYENVEPLEFEGATYPGIKISYDAGVGESPEDEYVLYYHPETYKMAWLGYTVTFFSKEKSKEFHFIKYGNWQDVEGMLLPETISWYNYDNNLPTTKRNDLQFVDVKVSKEKPDQTAFNPPQDSEIIE
ncbi:DUF6503 family protein [Cognatitamlana onchidii]|uniref:DUF6503 family protein n=1 Tax=Cognatitamlana onchidii TaxID=2562860 RepID=UPI0010A68E77|nr:DUF6503 family protein [Algibacter onchidii]